MSNTNRVRNPDTGKFEKTLPPDEASKIEAQRAVEEILANKSKDSAEPIPIPDDSIVGASPETDAAVDPGQADFIPGTRHPDPTYLPERIYDEGMGVVRQVTLRSEYHYVWVVDVKLTQFRANGYKFCLHDGGSQSGLANRGFLGTGLYERTLDNHIRNGDTFLMYAPIRLYEQMQQADRDQIDAWTIAAQKDLHNEGYRRGVRTFEEVDGQTIYN
jgi:hypothetical protein